MVVISVPGPPERRRFPTLAVGFEFPDRGMHVNVASIPSPPINQSGTSSRGIHTIPIRIVLECVIVELKSVDKFRLRPSNG